jgi:hypothetical protein
MDVNSHQATYTYAKKSTYEPVIYLTERYHNDKRPDAARAAINLNGSTAPNAPAVDSPVLLNPVSKRAAIDYNHDMRTEYPTVFVLSHANDVLTNRVLFFYNALEENGVLNPSEVMSYEKTEVPAYFNRGVDAGPIYNNLTTGNFATTYPSNVFRLLGEQYGNCKEYNLNPYLNNDLTGGLNEIRLFPVMTTAAFQPGRIPTASTVLLSVVLGEKPLQSDALNTVRAQLQALFPEDQQPDISDNLQVSIGNGQEIASMYIVSVAQQKLSVLASHDPNNLFVTKIDTLPNGKYKAYFSLRICNQGEMTETSPMISFQDLTGGHYANQPVLLDPMTNVTVQWRMETGTHSVTLDHFDINGVPPNYQPRCRFLHFSIETDQVGVEQLYKESPKALRTCVFFSGATNETATDCSENDVLKADDLKPVPDPNPVDNDCWILFLIALIVLILIIYAWYNNRQEPS